jgi:signal transduction histidine kinase
MDPIWGWCAFAAALVACLILAMRLHRYRTRTSAAEATSARLEETIPDLRKSAEESDARISQLDRLLERLVASIPMGLAVLDPQFAPVRTNRPATVLFPGTNGSFDSARLLSILGFDAQTLQSMTKTATIDGREVEIRVVRSDDGFLCVFVDRTEEREFRRREAEFDRLIDRIFDESPSGLILLDGGFNPVKSSRTAKVDLRAIGVRAEPGVQTVRMEDRTLEVRLASLDPGWLCALVDRTESRRLQEEMRARETAERERVDAARLTESRDRFLQNALQELKMPHSPINVQLQTLDKLLARGEPPLYATKLIGTPRRHTALLARLVEDILTTARAGSGSGDLNPEEVDLAELVYDVADGYRQHFAAVNCPVEFDIVGPIPGRWDWMRVEQAIANLMNYALLCGPNRPIRISVRHDREKVHIGVHCYGTAGAASDFGVAMTRRIVEAHGGSIRIEDEGGLKSTVRVELPRVST